MSSYNYVDLLLFPDYFYSYSVNLEDDTYNLEFQYNDFAKLWYLSIYTEDQLPLILGVALVPGYPISGDYIIEGLSGFFWLYPIQKIYTDKYQEFPENIDQYYTFKYIHSYIE